MGHLQSIIVSLLLGGRLRGRIFFRCRAGFPLLRPTAHGTDNSTRGRTFSRVPGDGPNGGTASGTASGTFGTATARRTGIVRRGLLFSLFLFGGFACRRRRFWIDAGILLC